MKFKSTPKLILIDRDGCINKKAGEGEYVYKIEDFQIYPDVARFFLDCETLNIKTAVISNQQGVGKGIYSESDVVNLHSKLIEFCGLKNVRPKLYFCPHIENTCDCRKPQPKLILEALQMFKISAEDAIFIGDSDSDRKAAESANVLFIEMQRNNDSTERLDSSILTSFQEIDFGIGSNQ
jgi:D-glycero-D-manno-heptose 1,7-bisphosphate phosphatase